MESEPEGLSAASAAQPNPNMKTDNIINNKGPLVRFEVISTRLLPAQARRLTHFGKV
jgi:hypothetical protein